MHTVLSASELVTLNIFYTDRLHSKLEWHSVENIPLPKAQQSDLIQPTLIQTKLLLLKKCQAKQTWPPTNHKKRNVIQITTKISRFSVGCVLVIFHQVLWKSTN